MTWKNVKQFSTWYWNEHHEQIDPPDNPLKVVPGKSLELVLWRHGQFQAELVILYPDVPVQPHKHPNVDAREYHICGKGTAVIKGRKIPEIPRQDVNIARRFTPILAGVVHYGIARETTIVVSCQHWKLGVEPTFITDNWIGEPW